MATAKKLKEYYFMRRLITLLLFVALLFSVVAAGAELSQEYYLVYARVSKLSIEELEQLKEDIDTLIAVNKMLANNDTEEKDNEDLGIWVKKYFVDSFKDPTDEKYITTKTLIKGTFSNSAATNKDLKVKLIISQNYSSEAKGYIPAIAIELYEYGSNKVKNSGLKEAEYTIYTKTDDGNVDYTRGFMYKNGDRIYLKKDSSNEVLFNMIKNNKTLKFKIDEETKYSKSTYNFTIDDTTGFDNAFNWLMSDDN